MAVGALWLGTKDQAELYGTQNPPEDPPPILMGLTFWLGLFQLLAACPSEDAVARPDRPSRCG